MSYDVPLPAQQHENLKRPFFCTCNCCCSHEMLLRHQNWELEAVAAVLLIVPYWGMDIIHSL